MEIWKAIPGIETKRDGFRTGLYKSAQKSVSLTNENGEKIFFRSMAEADRYLCKSTGYVSNCIFKKRFPKSKSGEAFIAKIEADAD